MKLLAVLFPVLFLNLVVAQEFPSKPIRIVIPYAPGGGSDILARPAAPIMGELLKQSIVIENKGGAAGNIGAQLVASSAADGYTLLLANNSQVINPFIYKNPGYNMATDFEPISLLGTSPVIIVVNKSLGISSLKELVDLALKNPGKLNFGSPGAGTPGHMANLLFNQKANLKMTHIPYKGSGPTTLALLQKEIDVFFGTPAAVAPYIKSGDFKALAVTSKGRFESFLSVPTVAESGMPDLSDFYMEIWWGLLAPAHTDPSILDKLHEATVRAVNDPKNRERWLVQGMVPTTTTRAEYKSIILNDLKRWGKIVKDNNVKAD